MFNMYKKLFMERENFVDENLIKKYIVESKYFNPDEEDIKSVGQLLILETDIQKTYLISSNKRLYFIVDDIRRQKPHVNWSIDKSDIIANGHLTAPIEAKRKTSKAGILNIGNKFTNGLYSTDLFTEETLTVRLQELLGVS